MGNQGCCCSVASFREDLLDELSRGVRIFVPELLELDEIIVPRQTQALRSEFSATVSWCRRESCWDQAVKVRTCLLEAGDVGGPLTGGGTQ